jgi:hypothetical protein
MIFKAVPFNVYGMGPLFLRTLDGQKLHLHFRQRNKMKLQLKNENSKEIRMVRKGKGRKQKKHKHWSEKNDFKCRQTTYHAVNC